MPPAPIPKIAIIGAGPAGLTLARLLLVSSAPVSLTIYERDASRDARPDQGGSLDLHTETGLAALRLCGLWDAFLAHARYDGQEMIMADKNATRLVHVGAGATSGGRPEIDRGRLQEVLLASVPDGCVRWGRTLREVTPAGMLRFAEAAAPEGPFDLVVGADGAWSRVRPLLSTVRPRYAGVSGYETEILRPAATCPRIDAMVGRGAFFGVSEAKLLNGQRTGSGSIKVRSWFVGPEEETAAALARHGAEGIVDAVLARYAGWAPELTELFRRGSPERLRLWPLYELPLGFRWQHRAGFTLIGDAASLAAPFSGEGVNKAMTDAVHLAALIERSQSPHEQLTLDAAVDEFERTSLFPRSEKIMAKTAANKRIMFGQDTPISMFTGLLKSVASESDSVFVKLLGTFPVVALVFSYFWVRVQIGWAVRRFWRRT